MSGDLPIPDPPLSAEQAALVATLSAGQIASIDAALMAHAKIRSRKVAMIVALAMANQTDRIRGIPDLFYAQRVRKLVADGRLIAEGNLAFMGLSEVRLP